jgi:hypothetical protein
VQRRLERVERVWTGFDPRAVLAACEHVAHQASLRARSHAPNLLLDRPLHDKARVQHRVMQDVLLVRRCTREHFPGDKVGFDRFAGELSPVNRALREVPPEGRGGHLDPALGSRSEVHLELACELLAAYEEKVERLAPFDSADRPNVASSDDAAVRQQRHDAFRAVQHHRRRPAHGVCERVRQGAAMDRSVEVDLAHRAMRRHYRCPHPARVPCPACDSCARAIIGFAFDHAA